MGFCVRLDRLELETGVREEGIHANLRVLMRPLPRNKASLRDYSGDDGGQ